MMRIFIAVIFAAFTAVGLAQANHHMKADFVGTWKVADTSGESFEIVLGEDGTATADRAGEGMTGTWKEDGGAAVISWKSGWTTKIMKDGESYKKVAFEKGGAEGDPTNSSAAEKVK